MNIGKLIQQPGGYKAFIPEKFPPDKKIIINAKTQQLHARAVLMLGKLDGITQLLPDLDFFILMYIILNFFTGNILLLHLFSFLFNK